MQNIWGAINTKINCVVCNNFDLHQTTISPKKVSYITNMENQKNSLKVKMLRTAKARNQHQHGGGTITTPDHPVQVHKKLIKQLATQPPTNFNIKSSFKLTSPGCDDERRQQDGADQHFAGGQRAPRCVDGERGRRFLKRNDDRSSEHRLLAMHTNARATRARPTDD